MLWTCLLIPAGDLRQVKGSLCVFAVACENLVMCVFDIPQSGGANTRNDDNCKRFASSASARQRRVREVCQMLPASRAVLKRSTKRPPTPSPRSYSAEGLGHGW